MNAERSEETSADSPEYVVGIGASAGGLEALERFFKAMPLDTGMAFVVVQHLSPDFKSLMDELLARFTRLAVVRVGAATELRANTIYLLVPNKEMVMADGQLTLVDRLVGQQVHLPISRFFRSLAREKGEKAIGIVLSGTGSDGSIGIGDIHDAGGLTVAQSVESAKFDGMPRAAVATGFVQHVMSPEEMAGLLLRHVADPGAAKHAHLPGASDEPGTGLPGLFERLREAYGIDFALYKPATILRRIDRRMELGQFRTQEEYCERVLEDPSELDALYRDLLIGVTRFFRDPELFEILSERVVPEIVAAAPPDEPIRVWTPGCATGEEPYSLAMLFLLELEKRGRKNGLRVFASDVHRESLRVAGEGVYSAASLETLPPILRDQFFVTEPEGTWRVTARLRKTVLFSQHNVLRDVPFNRMDLVSCRNLLIYFKGEAQTRALSSFYFALKVRGHLVLGPSESTGEFEREFTTVDRPWKVYRKDSEARLPLDVKFTVPAPLGTVPARRATFGDPRMHRVYDTLLERFVPPAVLVNDRREVQHVFGAANRYLRPSVGRPTLDVVAMCEGDLRIAVSSTLANSAKRRERVVVHGVRTDAGVVDVVAEPVEDTTSGTSFTLLQLAPVQEASSAAAADARTFSLTDEMAARFGQMEVELRDTRESLQTMIEELETTNEELQASNEELLAGNEELQSTNEELQSVNEELFSINAEHDLKIRELAATTADLRNLMAATHAGIVFTDAEQVVRLYTPGAADVLNLLPQDVGRPLSHITSRIADDDIVADLTKVHGSGKPVEALLSLPSDRYYLRRILPYENADHEPAGFVITFVDVTERRRAEIVADAGNALLKVVIDASPAHIAVLDRSGVIIATNLAWDVFGSDNGGNSGRSLVGQSYFDCCRSPSTTPDAETAFRLIREVLDGRSKGADLDYPCASPNEERWFWMNVVPLPLAGGGALVSHTDITMRKKADALESKLQETSKLDSLGILAAGVAHDFSNILAGILANVEVVRTDAVAHATLDEPLSDIKQAAQRASDLCRQMLAYSGGGQSLMSRVDLSAIVRDAVTLVRSSFAKKAGLALELAPHLPLVEADAAQIEQVVMNIALNASEAGRADGVLVRLRTGLATPTRQARETEIVAPTRPAAPHVMLEVSDNGTGIEPSILKRIFEPFFSTKFAGRGLGLAAVQGIVRGHGGALFVSSDVATGTTFRMLLPVADDAGEGPRDATPRGAR